MYSKEIWERSEEVEVEVGVERVLAQFYTELGAWVRGLGVGGRLHPAFGGDKPTCGSLQDWGYLRYPGRADLIVALSRMLSRQMGTWLLLTYPELHNRVLMSRAYPFNVLACDLEEDALEDDVSDRYSDELERNTVWRNPRRLAFLADRMQWAALVLENGDE